MTFTNKMYDVIKWLALIVLPALGTLYVAMANIWGFPYASEVLPSIMGIAVFLGVVIEFVNYQWQKANTGTYLAAVKVYDVLKWAAQVALPAVGALYLTIANIWGLPYGDQVTGMIVAIDLFLGVIVQFMSEQYNIQPE